MVLFPKINQIFNKKEPQCNCGSTTLLINYSLFRYNNFFVVQFAV